MAAPHATKFSLVGSTSMTDIFIALFAHFNRVDAVKKWEIDSRSTYNGGSPGSGGFTVVPTTPDGFQLNFRRTTTTVSNVTIDPAETITNSGDTSSTPTGISPLAHAEQGNFRTAYSGVANTFMLLEWDDALMILLEDTGGLFYNYGMHAGRIYEPLMSGITGLDGLGTLGYIPAFTSTATNWFGSSGATNCRLRVGATGIEASDWMGPSGRTAQLWYPAAPTTDLQGVRSNPNPCLWFANATLASYTAVNLLGVLKYIFRVAVYGTDKQRVSDETGTVHWMHFGALSATNPTYSVVPYPDDGPLP